MTRVSFLCASQALLCAAMLSCSSEPESSSIEVVEPEPAPIDAAAPSADPADAPQSEPANVDATVTPDAEPEQSVVYFGTFRDYLAAAQYSESLRSAGLLLVNIERARGGGELIVTDPMDRDEADALAERLGGRVMTEDSARRLIESLGLVPR